MDLAIQAYQSQHGPLTGWLDKADELTPARSPQIHEPGTLFRRYTAPGYLDAPAQVPESSMPSGFYERFSFQTVVSFKPL